MTPHIGVIALAALTPMVIGFIWYNPKIFGKAWMKAAWLNEEKLKGGNMPVIFGLSYVLSFMLGIILFTLVIHQTDIYSLFMNKEGFGVDGSETMTAIQRVMDLVGDNYRTFGHGVVHGSALGIFLVLPIMATNALFERKGGRYIIINAGYWTLTLALMGGIICQWA